MRKSDAPDPAAADIRSRSNFLSPFVALLAHPDEKTSAYLRDVFEDVACDWRLARVPDGTAASRHIVSKGLPDLLVVGSALSEISGPELVEWMRSFRGAVSIPVLVYGDPVDDEAHERFLRGNVRLIVPASSSRQILARHFTDLVALVEKRRFALPA